MWMSVMSWGQLFADQCQEQTPAFSWEITEKLKRLADLSESNTIK